MLNVHIVPLALVLFAAVAHATWNVAAKRVRDGGAVFVWAYSSIAASICVPLAIVTYLLLRPSLGLREAAIISVSCVVQLTYFQLLQRAYSESDISVVYPVARGLAPVIAVSAAVLLLHEHPGALGLAAVVAIVTGVLIVGFGGAQRSLGDRRAGATRSLAGFAPSPGERLGLLYGGALALLIGLYLTWDAWSVTTIGIPVLIIEGATNATRALVLAPLAARRRSEVARIWREHRGEVITVGVLSPLAYILVLFAFTLAPISAVAPARELSIVLVSLAGWVWLGETRSPRRLIGACVVVGGVIALAMNR
jgi:drug/metabolite transporter (DMT)-like permease